MILLFFIPFFLLNENLPGDILVNGKVITMI